MKTLLPLEYGLRSYENLCFLSQISETARGNTRFPAAWELWPEFRAHLLNAPSGEKFSPAFNPGSAVSEVGIFIKDLHVWCGSSRREFKLGPDLQLLLANTSLKDIAWKDVLFPHDGFVVSLAEPVAVGALSIGSALFSLHRGAKGEVAGHFWLFDADMPEVPSISRNERTRLLHLCRAQGGRHRRAVLDELNSLTDAYVNGWPQNVTFLSVRTDMLEDVPIPATVSTVNRALIGESRMATEEMERQVDCLVRLVVGTCLYLETLGAEDSPGRSPIWQPAVRPKGLDRRAVVDGAQVCNVSTKHVLTPEQRTGMRDVMHGRASAEMCAHFRRAHKRRLPGKGNDPTAEKTVRVASSFVNEHRLGPNMAPGGASSKVRLAALGRSPLNLQPPTGTKPVGVVISCPSIDIPTDNSSPFA